LLTSKFLGGFGFCKNALVEGIWGLAIPNDLLEGVAPDIAEENAVASENNQEESHHGDA